MTYADQADINIELLERDLAALQTESAYGQLDAALVRQRLKDTLRVAVSVVERLSFGMDDSLQRMADDLNG